MIGVSLCSYTYNDGRLLHGLLEHVRGWSRLPDEVVLVDDGSDPPFALCAAEGDLPVRIIRLPRNSGFCAAKQAGLSAARGEVLLSLDCDARVSPDFLLHAAAQARVPQVGMVTGCSGRVLGADVFSRYLDAFDDKFSRAETGPVDFINGGSFALRRAVWEEVGGFAGHGARDGEDHYLCRAIRARGYQLLLDSRIETAYARIMTRHAYCRRMWAWCGAAWIGAVRDELSLPEFFAAFCLPATLRRCALIAERFPRVFLYYELLQALALAFAFCAALGAAGRVPADAGVRLAAAVDVYLKAYPALRSLIRADLLRIGALPARSGHAPLPEATGPLARVCDWTQVLHCFDSLSRSGTLAALNREDVPLLLAGDAALTPDFSTYGEAGVG